MTHRDTPGAKVVPGAGPGNAAPSAGQGHSPATIVPGALHATALTAVLGVLSALTGALAGLVGNPWLLMLPGAAAGLWATTWLSRTDVAGLRMLRTGPVRVRADGPVTQRLEWHNAGPRTLPPLQVSVDLPGAGPQVVRVPALEPGAVAATDLLGTAPRRGLYRGGTLLLVAEDPLGLTRRTHTVSLGVAMVVHPAAARPYSVTQAVAGTRDGDRVVRPAGIDLAGLRAWRPGDERRDVHRRATARRGHPIVVERDRPHSSRWLLALAGPISTDTDEQALARAVATCLRVRQDGTAAHLICWPANASGAMPAALSMLTAPDGDATALLDWCAALPPLALPSPAQVIGAARASSGGDAPDEMEVLVMSGTPPVWEADLAALSAGADVRLTSRRAEAAEPHRPGRRPVGRP